MYVSKWYTFYILHTVASMHGVQVFLLDSETNKSDILAVDHMVNISTTGMCGARGHAIT